MQSDPHHDETLEPAGQQSAPGGSGDSGGDASVPAPHPVATPLLPGAQQPPPEGEHLHPDVVSGPVPPPAMPPVQSAPREPMADMRFPAASDPSVLPADEQSGVESMPAAVPTEQFDSPTYAEAAPPPGDWLDRVCPYLLSEDGTWRSTQPDLGHRCMAQEPPGELPPMFQERFCLSDRHVRCEWYKDAQASRSVAPERDGTGDEQAQGGRFRPSVPSVSLALGTSSSRADAAGGGSRRPPRALLIALGLVGGFIALVLIALLLGGGGDDGAGEADSSPAATAVVTAAPTTRPTTRPTSAPTAASTTSPTADPTRTGEPVLDDIRILYEVQPGERLEAIAAHFGIKRRRIIRANEGMVDAVPQVETGQFIIIPVPAGTSIEEITSLAGFDSFVEGPGT